MTVRERDIEQKLRRKVKAVGGKCLKWVCPGCAGVPDRIVLLPNGQIVFVEVKRPKGGRLGVLQKWWAKTLIDMGFDYEMVWDDADIELFEDMYLKEVQ